MSGCIEVGNCDICKKTDVHISRQYYYYDIQCTCCGSKHNGKNVHFEIVYHCNECTPKPPYRISATVKPIIKP